MRGRGTKIARKIIRHRGDLEQRCRLTGNNSEELDPFDVCTFFAIELSAINGAIELKVSFLKQGLEYAGFCENVGRRRRRRHDRELIPS